MDKEKKEKKIKDPNKVTFAEKCNLVLRRTWVANGLKTFLIVIIIILLYMSINIGIRSFDIPEIDVTENQIFTLSDVSKKAVEKIDKEITIYSYGFEEDSSLIDLLKQYNKANDKIKYEMLTEEKNLEMIKENDLVPGYMVLILKSGDEKKIIDAKAEFMSYDSMNGQGVDITEQTITNSLLGMTEENKPMVYFLEGHEEFRMTDMTVLISYLKNEAFNVAPLNLAVTGKVPDDCDILAITSPGKDFLENEAQAIKDYIHKGGNIYYTMDVISTNIQLPNIQSVLDEYGVTVKNGYILEDKKGSYKENYPYIISPEVSPSHRITADIYTDSVMWLVYSSKLEYKDQATLDQLRVNKETLLSSSDQAVFVNDLTTDITESVKSSELGKFDIAAAITKNVTVNENGEDKEKASNLIISAAGNFATDIKIPAISQGYPLSYLGSNKDFAINALSYLGKKENNLTIRKDMSSSTYLPTVQENLVVLAIIIFVPVFIIITGIVIWHFRKKRK